MISPVKKHKHDPNAVLDYWLDWSDWLTDDDEVVVNCSWRLFVVTQDAAGNDTDSVTEILDGVSDAADTTPLLLERSEFGDTITTVWLKGGTAGRRYFATAHVTSDSDPTPRQDDRSIELRCLEQ